MLSLIGAHYAELVIIAMTLFAVGLFSVSVQDSMYRRKNHKSD